MSYFKNQMTSPNDDIAAGIEVTDEFERFTQRDDVFTRAFWDEKVRTKQTDGFFASYRMEATPRRGDGFTQRDFALRKPVLADLLCDNKSTRRSGPARRISGPYQLGHASRA